MDALRQIYTAPNETSARQARLVKKHRTLPVPGGLTTRRRRSDVNVGGRPAGIAFDLIAGAATGSILDNIAQGAGIGLIIGSLYDTVFSSEKDEDDEGKAVMTELS